MGSNQTPRVGSAHFHFKNAVVLAGAALLALALAAALLFTENVRRLHEASHEADAIRVEPVQPK